MKKMKKPHKVHLTPTAGLNTGQTGSGLQQLHHVRPAEPNPYTKKWDTPCPDSGTLGLCNLDHKPQNHLKPGKESL